jgi:hypothetical protein
MAIKNVKIILIKRKNVKIKIVKRNCESCASVLKSMSLTTTNVWCVSPLVCMAEHQALTNTSPDERPTDETCHIFIVH